MKKYRLNKLYEFNQAYTSRTKKTHEYAKNVHQKTKETKGLLFEYISTWMERCDSFYYTKISRFTHLPFAHGLTKAEKTAEKRFTSRDFWVFSKWQ